MAERQPTLQESFLVPGDRALIGLVFEQDGSEVTRYFTDDAAADAAIDGATVPAVQLIGAWSDLDWGEMEGALDRIRHESPPSPPIEA